MKLVFQKSQRRSLFSLLWIAGALLLGLWSFVNVYQKAINLYCTPSEALTLPANQRVRVGGLLQEGSLHYDEDIVYFTLTDKQGGLLPVRFTGTPPRLLKVNQDTVVTGTYQPPYFEATEVLAKHDEYYRPKTSSSPELRP